MTRLTGLDGAALDAVVIGGGMAGAGVARDLALRGASVALFEKGDFASGTTSKSSKLIHGGLRYLELFDWRLVRESLREKKTLERLAPHLVRPLPFLVPIYPGSKRGLITVRIGMWLYDLLTPGKVADRYRVMRPVEALSLEPTIRPEDLRGVGYYTDDLLLFPERLCLENVLSAIRHGARAHNYCEVEEIVRSGDGIEGVRVRDLLTAQVSTIRARVVINCAGPWVDRLRELAGLATERPRVVRTTKGIHCLLPRMTERAIYLSAHDDRMVFVIPWRDFSLVGTTDTDFEGDPDRLWATRGEVTYLLETVAQALPDRRVALDNVAYTYAGVRPLSFEEGRSASKVSREHKVVAEGPGGRFLSVTGTKLTCFRSLAEEIGDRVMQALGRRAPSPDGSAQPGRRGRGRGRGRSARVHGRVGGDGGERPRPRGLAGARRHLWPGVSAGARPGEEAPRRDRTPLPVESGDRRSAPSRRQRRAGRLATGRAPAAHRDRPEPLPGSRLRGVDRRPDGRAPGMVGAPARRRARRLSAARRPKPALPGAVGAMLAAQRRLPGAH